MIRAICAIGWTLAIQAEVKFNRDIRPIMSDTCFRCHGPDKSSRMAGLRLDLREEALKPTKSGAVPLVPGDPEGSAVITRVFATGAKIMPPKHAHKELSEAQKQTLKQWVAEGANYEGHWSYQPVERVAPPAGGHPVDAIVRARFAKEGLTPAPPADKRTLLRRVTLDLTGLPPTPEEIAAFLADNDPKAYEKVVSRLLSSPRYAEKQAMLWLDAVRYADTCGFHGDNPFPAWPYRDYVLRSFRDNKPFDEFTREQIAGDLLPNATPEQRAATAYHRLTRTSAEGGLQPKEYLAKYAADRVRTTSNVWLGSTMGCAECHDHKFDPFTAKDFYSFKAFFADIKEDGFVADRGLDAWGAQLAIPTPEQASALAAAEAKLADARRRLVEASVAAASRREEWEQTLAGDLRTGKLIWRVERPIAVSSKNGSVLKVYGDEPLDSVYEWAGSLTSSREPGRNAIVASGPNPDNETYTVTLAPAAGRYTAIGIEVIQDESLPGVRMARGSDRLLITEAQADVVQGARVRPIRFSFATAGMFDAARTPDLPAMAVIDGDPKTGWGVSMFGDARNPMLALRFAEPLTIAPGTKLRLKLAHDSEYRRATLGRFRLALSQAEYAWPEPVRRGPTDSRESLGITDDARKALEIPAAERTPAQMLALLEHFRFADAQLAPLAAEVAKLEAEHGLLLTSIPHVVVTESTEPRLTRLLARGNWMDESGEVVEPAIPSFLGTLNFSGQRATRLDLANWLVDKSNPLTARVFVNRTWRQFFGVGLSKVLDDLGSQGELPVHAELLDWLAAEFMTPSFESADAHSWDIKHLIWTIVTSETYKASSAIPAGDKDPENRFFARQNRFRVEAESVRDIALSVSGLLHEKFGGPSVRPWQPDGFLAALNFPKRDYSASRAPDTYRRSVYSVWQRTFLNPSLATFDAPSREECTVNRVSSNTPLQALVLLNDPGFLEASRVLAQNMWGQAPAKRIDRAFERSTGRLPSQEERQLLDGLYRRSLAEFRNNPAAARDLISVGEAPRPTTIPAANLAAYTVTARAILNLHETITRN